MSAGTPPILSEIAPILRCPHCGSSLVLAEASLECSRGHRFDVSREGYVSLLSQSPGREAGDDAAMIAARERVEAAGHWRPFAQALAAAAGDGWSTVCDIGAGTGFVAAALLSRVAGTRGVAIDVSTFACRRAARAHPALAAVRADVWSSLPLRDGVCDLALDVFAPRNGPELARVLSPGGTLLVVTPAAGHLEQLRQFHTLSIDPDKDARLRDRLGSSFAELDPIDVRWSRTLTGAQAAEMLRMGPSARHLRRGALRRLAGREEPVAVSAAVTVRPFRRVG